jgi:Flp pilus assembly pilin Flp
VRDERGATAVEVGLMVACICVAIITAIQAFSGNLIKAFNKASTAIGGS